MIKAAVMGSQWDLQLHCVAFMDLGLKNWLLG